MPEITQDEASRRDWMAREMLWSMDPQAIRTWLWAEEDREYAEDMRRRLNKARQEAQQCG